MQTDKQVEQQAATVNLAQPASQSVAVTHKSHIKSLTQISNLFRNGFKSFSQISKPHFLSIPNLSRSNLKSNLKCLKCESVSQRCGKLYSLDSWACCRRHCDTHESHSRPATHAMTVHVTILNTHTRLTALFPVLPRWAGTRKVKPIWILLKQETVSDSGISCAMCKSAPRSRQITTPAPHHSKVFLQAWCPSCRPTNSIKALKAMAG